MSNRAEHRLELRAAPLRAVLLDCLGTLLRLEPPGPRLRAELSARGIEVTEAAAATAIREEIAYYVDHHVEGRDASSLERLRDACAGVIAAALELPPERSPAVRAAMLDALHFSRYPDAAAALRALRAAGLRLVVTSNWDCSLERALVTTGLRELVHGVVTSAAVGAAKPDPAVFRAGLELAGCDATQAVCVGDSPERDVVGARAAGIEALLLVRDGPAPTGAPVVRSLDEARYVILAGG